MPRSLKKLFPNTPSKIHTLLITHYINFMRMGCGRVFVGINSIVQRNIEMGHSGVFIGIDLVTQKRSNWVGEK